jgi:glycosyltransferase involved in cell wall biosynthesis
MTPTWLAIVIPVRNGMRTVPALVEALDVFARQEGVEVLFVDDASTDETAEYLRQRGYCVLARPAQSGPARARNEGARATSAPWILFLDADTVPPPNTLDRVRVNLSVPGAVGMIGVYAARPANSGFWPEYKAIQADFYHRRSDVQAVTFLWGGMCAVRRDVFIEAGGFDESYRGAELEDVALGRRMTSRGKILLDRQFVVGHHFPDTLSANVRNHFHRGRLWVELYRRSGGRFENYLATPAMALSRFALLAAPLFAVAGYVTASAPAWIAALSCLGAYAAITRQLLVLSLHRRGCGFMSKVVAAEILLSAVLVAAAIPAFLTPRRERGPT